MNTCFTQESSEESPRFSTDVDRRDSTGNSSDLDEQHSEHLRIERDCAERERIYGELHPLVCRLINQFGDTPEQRKDLEGEIYLRFCLLWSDYDPNRGVPLKAYLIRKLPLSVYTYARSLRRDRRREVGLEPSSGGVDIELFRQPDPTADWIEALHRQDVVHELPAAMKRLSERQQRVVMGRYFEGRSFEEIAVALEIQPATVRSLLRHGLNNLRKHLASFNPP